MQLTPREHERLLIFTAAELARRRLAEGTRLSHPDAVALAADIALETARRGATYDEVTSCVAGIFTLDQLEPGVADLLDGPIQVEAVFADGSRLVALRGLVAR
jgi:urease subunit gamma/beta